VEIVKRSFAAIASGDLDGLLSLYDPAVQFSPLTGTRWVGLRAYFDRAEALEAAGLQE
jgi:ketosteroid isomerase-like protein